MYVHIVATVKMTDKIMTVNATNHNITRDVLLDGTIKGMQYTETVLPGGYATRTENRTSTVIVSVFATGANNNTRIAKVEYTPGTPGTSKDTAVFYCGETPPCNGTTCSLVVKVFGVTLKYPLTCGKNQQFPFERSYSATADLTITYNNPNP
jgi:hypothetical protein